jgi:uncharacterized membrane protein
MTAFLGVLFRWLHIIPACLAIGGAFFMRLILPAALGGLEPEPRHAALLRARRVFKMLIHACILLLIVSGTYNAMGNWKKYAQVIPLSHALFGLHLILAIAVFVISIVVLLGKEPPASHRQWMTVNLVLLALLVAAGSSLKWVRDHAPPQPPPASPPAAAVPATSPLTP